MNEQWSPAVIRALERAEQWTAHFECDEIEPLHLLLAILEHSETAGAEILSRSGVELHEVLVTLDVAVAPAKEPNHNVESPPVSRTLQLVMIDARSAAGTESGATEHLALGMMAENSPLRNNDSSLGDYLRLKPAPKRDPDEAQESLAPLPAGFKDLGGSLESERPVRLRMIDAAANRAREGLRVIEDYVRFGIDHGPLTAQLKNIRHRLQGVLELYNSADLLSVRDTENDVGTQISTASEMNRADIAALVAANFKRTQEALRTLEEVIKIDAPIRAGQLESSRYQLYELERQLGIVTRSVQRLEENRLYVLVSSTSCSGGIEWTVEEILKAGCRMIQLREKGQADGEFVRLARTIRELTRAYAATFIVNDRPDIARIADADGVHVGQEEIHVQDARRVVGPRSLIGLSTHSLKQARQAVRAGADYIGVGPMFPSRTKSFESYPGTSTLRDVIQEIKLPSYAIGGVDVSSLGAVREVGCTHIAVSSVVCESDDPGAVATELLTRLNEN